MALKILDFIINVFPVELNLNSTQSIHHFLTIHFEDIYKFFYEFYNSFEPLYYLISKIIRNMIYLIFIENEMIFFN